MKAHNIWMTSHRGEACERQAARDVIRKETPIRQEVDVKIKDKIKRIRDTFGLIKERDSRNVSFAHLMRLFDAVKKHLKGAVGDETALRILSAAEKIKKTVRTLLKKIKVNEIGNINYA